MLWASVCIHTRRSLNFSVPCVPTSTPQGYTALSPHPHPMMRTLPLAPPRRTFRWALLWSTLLASFLVQGSSTVLYNIALCGNIIISILRLVEEYFSGWYLLCSGYGVRQVCGRTLGFSVCAAPSITMSPNISELVKLGHSPKVRSFGIQSGYVGIQSECVGNVVDSVKVSRSWVQRVRGVKVN